MYLSSLMVNTGEDPDRPRPGRLWLRNVYRVHQRLCMAFPSVSRRTEDPSFLRPFDPNDFGGTVHIPLAAHIPRAEDAGFLFRIDPQPGGRTIVLVQSATPPAWEYAFRNAPHLLAAPPATKPYDPRFETGERFRFRLVANPTRKVDKEGRPEGKKNFGRRVPVPLDQLPVWLERKAAAGGFQIETLDLVQAGYIRFWKDHENVAPSGAPSPQESDEEPGRNGRLRSVRIEGVLKVVDPSVFHFAVIRGIGPGKGFGCGLLSVVPLPIRTDPPSSQVGVLVDAP